MKYLAQLKRESSSARSRRERREFAARALELGAKVFRYDPVDYSMRVRKAPSSQVTRWMAPPLAAHKDKNGVVTIPTVAEVLAAGEEQRRGLELFKRLIAASARGKTKRVLRDRRLRNRGTFAPVLQGLRRAARVRTREHRHVAVAKVGASGAGSGSTSGAGDGDPAPKPRRFFSVTAIGGDA